MTRYILTGPAITGEVYADYSAAGALVRLDFSAAQLSEAQHWWFREHLPHTAGSVADIRAAINTPKVAVTDTRIALSFSDFWNPYGHKINRKRAEDLWNRLSAADKEAAISGIAPYFRYLAGTGFRAKKDPDTYLRTRTWEDKFPTAQPPPPKPKPVRTGETTVQNHLKNYAISQQQPKGRNRGAGNEAEPGGL